MVQLQFFGLHQSFPIYTSHDRNHLMEVNSLIKWYSKISTSESFDEKESSGQWRRKTSFYVGMTKTTNRGWTVSSSGILMMHLNDHHFLQFLYQCIDPKDKHRRNVEKTSLFLSEGLTLIRWIENNKFSILENRI